MKNYNPREYPLYMATDSALEEFNKEVAAINEILAIGDGLAQQQAAYKKAMEMDLVLTGSDTYRPKLPYLLRVTTVLVKQLNYGLFSNAWADVERAEILELQSGMALVCVVFKRNGSVFVESQTIALATLVDLGALRYGDAEMLAADNSVKTGAVFNVGWSGKVSPPPVTTITSSYIGEWSNNVGWFNEARDGSDGSVKKVEPTKQESFVDKNPHSRLIEVE